MATYQSKCAKGTKPVPSVQAGLVSRILYEYVTEANIAANDIVDLGPIPPGLTPLEVTLITDDLDTNGAPTVTMSVGVLNAAKTDLNGGTYDTFLAASVIGKTGGTDRSTTANAYLSGASATERRLGIKFPAGAATGVGAGKKIAVILDVQG